MPIIVIIGLSLASFALAQNIDVGINEVGNAISLSSTDPRIIIARIINIVLLFLGVIAVGLIIYAGFIWMTSAGNDEKIEEAKKILKNAIIGLVIILSSWGIATFILNRLLQATGSNGSIWTGSSGNSSLVGTGAIGACTIERVYPENGQNNIARNTVIIVSFKETLRLDSVCQDAIGISCVCDDDSCKYINPDNIRIFRTDLGDNCGTDTCPVDNTNVSDAVIKASGDRKTFIISPLALLGVSEGNIEYEVKLTNGLLKDNNDSIFKTCNTDSFQWGFEVSNNLDLTPPQVVQGGIFPLPDNENDIINQLEVAVAAEASIQVQACPNIYQAATITGVTPITGGQSATAVIDGAYHASISAFSVLSLSNNTQAQLFNGQNLMGVADWNDNQVVFPEFFSLTAAAHEAGNSWSVTISPEVLADQLTVGGDIYSFADNSLGNNILLNIVNNNCNYDDLASSIYYKLSGNPEIELDLSGSKVILTAKVAGANGNNIPLGTSNQEALALQAFSGGTDLVKVNERRDRLDRPMNSVIQLNFNEAMNPVLLSGIADEISDYIRVINADNVVLAGNSCEQASDCQSYQCENNVCVGDHLSGKFMVSNAYRTVEFISDEECGQNACGETIYCLPANSHLVVELVSANLKTCNSSLDCVDFTPFSACAPYLTYKTCQDSSAKNYPVADLALLDGIVDAASNSLDGNRDIFADGPLTFYNENNSDNLSLKDKYKWSFYINDQIALDPPTITYINPDNDSIGIDTNMPVQINFNTLMMNDSLRTGSTLIDNGQTIVEHHLLNIFSSVPTPMGYWVTAENQDISPLDGEPDTTYAFINHNSMLSSASYKSQVGSGVKDIYQNCFKPSAGTTCAADDVNPSCCYGIATSVLGNDGNCQ
jgi:hypothetical protein